MVGTESVFSGTGYFLMMLGQYKNCKPSQIEEMEIWLGVADPYTDIH